MCGIDALNPILAVIVNACAKIIRPEKLMHTLGLKTHVGFFGNEEN